MVLLHCTKDKVGTKVAVKRFFLSGKQCFVHPSAVTFQLTSHEGRSCRFSGVSVVFFVAHFRITVALSKT